MPTQDTPQHAPGSEVTAKVESNQDSVGSGIALCLSGGGFRATFFHLGVVAYMRRHKELENLTVISGVSGGSILAAHMLLNWEDYISDNDNIFNLKTRELYRFGQRDIRNRVLLRFPLGIITKRNATDYLRRQYKALYGNRSITATTAGASKPTFMLNASNLRTGKLLAFTQGGILYADKNNKTQKIESNVIPVSYAVAASSAFPALFPPIQLTSTKIGCSSQQLYEAGLDDGDPLSDGGVYDNIGFRALRLLESKERIETVIISDTAMELDWKHNLRNASHLRTPLRAVDVMMKRAHDLELEDSMQEFKDGLQHLSIAKETSSQGQTGTHQYQCHIDRDLKWLRTDLDKFHRDEIIALVKHGYTVAAEKLHKDFNPDFAGMPDWCQTRSSPERIWKRIKKGSRRRLISFPTFDAMTWAYTSALSLILIALIGKGMDISSKIKAYENIVTSKQIVTIKYQDNLSDKFLASNEVQTNQAVLASLKKVNHLLAGKSDDEIETLLKEITHIINESTNKITPESLINKLSVECNWPQNEKHDGLYKLIRLFSVQGRETTGKLYLHKWNTKEANEHKVTSNYFGVCNLRMPFDNDDIKWVMDIRMRKQEDIIVVTTQLPQNTPRPAVTWTNSDISMDSLGAFGGPFTAADGASLGRISIKPENVGLFAKIISFFSK